MPEADRPDGVAPQQKAAEARLTVAPETLGAAASPFAHVDTVGGWVYPLGRNDVSDTTTALGNGTLRLIHPLSGYAIHDVAQGRIVPVRWPGRPGGDAIDIDSLDDGAWALCVERRPPAEGIGYVLYWTYPFSVRIHQWLLDEEGIRVGARELSGPETATFLASRINAHVAYASRLIVIAIGSAGNEAALPSLIAQVDRRLIQSSVELAVLCANRPRLFSVEQRAIAQETIDTFLDELCCVRPRNPASMRSRVAALRALIAYDQTPATAARRATVDFLIALGEHVGHALPYLPCGANVTFPRSTTEEAILTAAGIECFFFELELREGALPQVIIPYPYNLYNRIVFTISYLNYLTGEYITRPSRLAEFAERFQLAKGAMIRCPVYTHDLPPDLGLPAIGFERSKENREITLIPDLYYFNSFGYRELRRKFRAKSINWEDRQLKFLWRGSTTGFQVLDMQNIHHLPRVRLCLKAMRFSELMDTGFTAVAQAASPEEQQQIETWFTQRGFWRNYVPMEEMAAFRFLFDIDGNANSWGFFAKLLLGSCVLKVDSTWEQWFYHDVRPWEHFVPIADDLSDFEEKVEWCLSHEAECQQIAKHGQEFALARGFGVVMDGVAEAILGAERLFAQ